jgi:hypothetical protein
MAGWAAVRKPLATLACISLIAGALSACDSAPPVRIAAAPSTSASAPSEIATTATPAPSATAAPSASAQAAAKPCNGFPANNVWRADVSKLPVHRSSAAYVGSIGSGSPVHADFGSGTWDGGPIGIPVTTVKPGQAGVKVTFQYASESDKVAYPIPSAVKIEGGPDADGDRHIILLDPAGCKVYELFAAVKSGGAWKAGSGAVFDLRSNKLRTAGWTSADAAGLPIFAGLVRYEEVAAGHIDHAIRVTVPRSQAKYLWPARHQASDSSSTSLPPMGLRLRLKASVNVAKLPKQARIVAVAMQKYGVIVADNGSPWFISGTPDERWDNDALHALGQLHGSDFEAVDASSLMADPNSAAVK